MIRSFLVRFLVLGYNCCVPHSPIKHSEKWITKYKNSTAFTIPQRLLRDYAGVEVLFWWNICWLFEFTTHLFSEWKNEKVPWPWYFSKFSQKTPTPSFIWKILSQSLLFFPALMIGFIIIVMKTTIIFFHSATVVHDMSVVLTTQYETTHSVIIASQQVRQ